MRLHKDVKHLILVLILICAAGRIPKIRIRFNLLTVTLDKYNLFARDILRNDRAPNADKHTYITSNFRISLT